MRRYWLIFTSVIEVGTGGKEDVKLGGGENTKGVVWRGGSKEKLGEKQTFAVYTHMQIMFIYINEGTFDL